MPLADRMNRLGTETAFAVLAKAKALEAQGKNLVHLYIGEPDFDTPKHIIDAGVEALTGGYTHYGPAAGLPELRQAIAEHTTKTRETEFTPDQVVVTPGAKPIMFFAILALVNEGDEVIYPNPGFPIYESVINFVGAKAVPLPLREENDFAFDPEELGELLTDKTKLVILNSPQNPTGGIVGRQALDRAAELIMEREDVWVLADEIYYDFVYDGKFESISSYPGIKDRLIILDGFSKSYAMTGWRMGYGVMPPALAEQIAKLQINSNSCTSTFSQRACLAALSGPREPVLEMVAEFKARRDMFVEGLNSLPGVSCKLPGGAFYVFPNFGSFGKTSQEMEAFLLNDAGVAGLSGTAFGKYGEGYLRFSYASSRGQLNEAINRLSKALGRL